MTATERVAWLIVSGITTALLGIAAVWLVRDAGGPPWAEALTLVVVLMGSLLMWRK